MAHVNTSPTPAGAETGPFAADQVTKLLERLAFQVHSTVQSRNPKTVHDLRVAIRRLTQALAALRPCFPTKPAKKIRRRLKAVMELAGEVRDHDIALKHLAKLDGPAQGSLRQKVEAQRREAERALTFNLRLWTARKTSSKWRAALDNGGPSKDVFHTPLGSTAGENLAPMAKEFFRKGDRAANGSASANDLHKFRILTKKFRYTLELFAGMYGPVAVAWGEQIKGVQTLLGDINDYRTARKVLADAGAGGKIDAALKKKQRKKTEDFQEGWEKDFGSVGKEWVHALSHPEEAPQRKAMGRSTTAGPRAARSA